MPQKRMECFRLLFDHLAWIEHQFLSGIRDSRKAGSLWEMMKGVGRVRKSIHQSWLTKGWGLGILRWGFKGDQEEIPSTEASTLQIVSVAFPPEQCTSPQLHPCHTSECPVYVTKQFDGYVPVMQDLWGMRSTPPLPSLPGPFCPGVVAPDRALSLGQIELNCVIMQNWIVWKRTIFVF